MAIKSVCECPRRMQLGARRMHLHLANRNPGANARNAGSKTGTSVFLHLFSSSALKLVSFLTAIDPYNLYAIATKEKWKEMRFFESQWLRGEGARPSQHSHADNSISNATVQHLSYSPGARREKPSWPTTSVDTHAPGLFLRASGKRFVFHIARTER